MLPDPPEDGSSVTDLSTCSYVWVFPRHSVLLDNVRILIMVVVLHRMNMMSVITLIFFCLYHILSSGRSPLFLGASEKLRKASISFAMSVGSSVHQFAWNNSASRGRIFVIFFISLFFENTRGI
jgi:hypothetical protein